MTSKGKIELSETTDGISDDRLYYGLILLASPGAKLSVCSNTEWVGWADSDMRIEMGRPRLEYLDNQIRWLNGFGIENCRIIDRDDKMFQYWLFGGACAIEETIAKKNLSERLKPKAVARSGYGSFEGLTVSMSQATRRAPTPNLRMQVLKCDNYRCRICGQNPSDDTNVVLHVHHIRPWSERGITDKNNLVTLCHTCHAGLDPHYDLALLRLIRDSSNEQHELLEGILHYREFVHSVMDDD